MYAFFRVKLKESFTNEGILYLGNQEHLFPDRIFPKIPSFIIEDFSEFKMPIDRREQLGFSAKLPAAKYIVDGLYHWNQKTPGSTKLIEWCILNRLTGITLLELIVSCYGDVAHSNHFWCDMLFIIDHYSSIDLEELEEILKHRYAMRGSITTSAFPPPSE